jgi:hypothetical protein
LIYEGDVIHHFKATELSYVRISITFVSSFISFLERCIKPSVQLEISKSKNPDFKRKEKNEEIISRNCIAHSYLSLDLFLFILFNYIDFGDMFRHQVPSSGQYYVMTTCLYNAMHMLISKWDPTTLSLLQYWNYLALCHY